MAEAVQLQPLLLLIAWLWKWKRLNFRRDKTGSVGTRLDSFRWFLVVNLVVKLYIDLFFLCFAEYRIENRK